MDKDLIYICDELKFFEKNLRDRDSSSNQASPENTQGNSSDQKSDDEHAPGVTSFTTDDCSFDFMARNLGAGLNWAFLSDDEEDEDRQLPWSLAKNMDR